MVQAKECFLDHIIWGFDIVDRQVVSHKADYAKSLDRGEVSNLISALATLHVCTPFFIFCWLI
jgi:hypothetical protein